MKRRAVPHPRTLANVSKGKHQEIPEDDADQDIEDDGMDVTQLGQAEDNSETSEDGEDEAIIDDDNESDEEYGGEDRMEWDGMGENGMGRSKHQKSDVAPPTTKDIKMINEASDLFGSNAFKLKINALMSALAPKASHVAPLEKCLFDIHAVISNLAEVIPQHPIRAAEALQGQGVTVVYPSPPPTEETNWKVGFSKPTDIKVVGSWANKVSVPAIDGRGLDIDLALEMPADLFQAKDHLNCRFFHKRAFYLAVIAAALVSSPKLSLDVMYDSPQADARRTCITLRQKPTTSPSDFSKLNATIRICLCLSPNTTPIAINRLSPSHSNLRLAATGKSDNLPGDIRPTPLYNNILLQSLTPITHLLAIYQYKSHIPAFSEALALLRVWANQRGFAARGKRIIRGFEAIGGAWWGFLLGMLVYGEGPGADGKPGIRRKPLGTGLSSYQLFRGAMDYLANRDFSTESVFMKSNESIKFPASEFISPNTAAFVDPSTIFNFLAGVPLESLRLLRHDAKATLRTLDQDGDAFDWTFMRDLRDLSTRFDVIIRIDISGATPRAESALDILEHGSRTNALLNSLMSTIRHALNTRITHCAILHSSSAPRPLDEPTPSSPTTVEIGLLLDPFEASRLVDHGPAAGDEAAGAEFREFWGPKAELRRFKDGSIVESVVWEVPNPDDRIHIPVMVVQHILDLHFGVPKSQATAVQAAYDPFLRSQIPSVGTGAAFRQALVSFDELFRTIKDLGDLPLSISQISPASEYLRYTSVHPATPLDSQRFPNLPDNARYIPAIDVILTFEGSTRWPEDLAAIQKVKLAFLEQIARAMSGQKVVRHAAVVLDADAGIIEDNCALELITLAGYAFRGRIHCDIERSLLEKFIAPKQKHWSVPTAYDVTKAQAKSALVIYKRRFVYGLQHHSAIAALQQRCPSYGPTTRLIKRWLGAHMLAPYVPIEIIELVCAHVYLCPGPFDAPVTAPTGFARVIRLLKEWNYGETPLYVPQYTGAGADPGVSVNFPTDKKAQADQAFRSRVGVVGWTVVTEEDPSGILFGSVLGPKGLIAARIRQVATATWECLDSGMTAGTLDVTALFQHPLDDYDFVIHLNPSLLPRHSQATHYDHTKRLSEASAYKNPDALHASTYGQAPRIDFDPAALLYQDLKRIYADTALFFYDPIGGDVIGGLWYPQIRNPRPFKVYAGYSTLAVGGEGKKPMVTLNEKAVLSEIERLGSGLITKIVRAA
ncbi:hypothetical protein FRB97_009629 [Tulasnella sp. 331]|nr:hypothetical protein FRB97_009629 [Tulasnella sp. 331]KAG8887916.1 hypothetical protein FRB98_008741 [Tulasnella sp. 332]